MAVFTYQRRTDALPAIVKMNGGGEWPNKLIVQEREHNKILASTSDEKERTDETTTSFESPLLEMGPLIYSFDLLASSLETYPWYLTPKEPLVGATLDLYVLLNKGRLALKDVKEQILLTCVDYNDQRTIALTIYPTKELKNGEIPIALESIWQLLPDEFDKFPFLFRRIVPKPKPAVMFQPSPILPIQLPPTLKRALHELTQEEASLVLNNLDSVVASLRYVAIYGPTEACSNELSHLRGLSDFCRGLSSMSLF